MRIAYFYNEEWEKEYISKRLPDETFNFIKGTMAENEAMYDPEATVLSVFVNSRVGAGELDRFQDVQLVSDSLNRI